MKLEAFFWVGAKGRNFCHLETLKKSSTKNFSEKKNPPKFA
jgi:hypothetical protein